MHDYYFHPCPRRPELVDLESLSLFRPEEISYGVDLPFNPDTDPKSVARDVLIKYDAEVTKTDFEELAEEFKRLSFDIDYFLKAYRWVGEEENQRSRKRFFLFNNLAYQLSRVITRLMEYHEIIYHSIYYDFKEEVITEYNEHLRKKLEELYRLGQSAHTDDYCIYSSVLNTHNVEELLHCLKDYSIASREFHSVDYNRFCEDFILGHDVVFSFSHILYRVTALKNVVEEIDHPKYAQRTQTECEYIYNTLLQKYVEENPDLEAVYHRALDDFCSNHAYMNDRKKIIEKYLNKMEDTLKDSDLGRIYLRHRSDSTRMFKLITESKAKRRDFEQYFHEIKRLDYLTNCLNRATGTGSPAQDYDQKRTGGLSGSSALQPFRFFNEQFFCNDERKQELNEVLQPIFKQVEKRQDWYAVLRGAQSVKEGKDKFGKKHKVLADKVSDVAMFDDLSMLMPELAESANIFPIDDKEAEATPSSKYKSLRNALSDERKRWTIKGKGELLVTEWEKTEYIPSTTESIPGKRINNKEEKYRRMLQIGKDIMAALEQLRDKYIQS